MLFSLVGFILVAMSDTIITSEPPANTTSKPKKRKMSAAGRKALADAAKARWAAKKAEASVHSAPAPVQPSAPAPPSPAVLKLQEQVVELVSQRHQARALLNESHNAYLAAQSKFQAAENELKGIEQEVQYRISLIAQLENRQSIASPVDMVNNQHFGAPLPALSGITSEPAQLQQAPRRSQETFAVGSADDLRRDIRGMM